LRPASGACQYGQRQEGQPGGLLQELWLDELGSVELAVVVEIFGAIDEDGGDARFYEADVVGADEGDR